MDRITASANQRAAAVLCWSVSVLLSFSILRKITSYLFCSVFLCVCFARAEIESILATKAGFMWCVLLSRLSCLLFEMMSKDAEPPRVLVRRCCLWSPGYLVTSRAVLSIDPVPCSFFDFFSDSSCSWLSNTGCWSRSDRVAWLFGTAETAEVLDGVSHWERRDERRDDQDKGEASSCTWKPACEKRFVFNWLILRRFALPL